MKIALDQAKKAFIQGNEIPVGAVLCNKDGEILAQAHNLCESHHDVTAHAEILALREASKKMKNSRLIGCQIWVTLEPCPMCMAALSFGRIEKLYFGAFDPKSGGVFLAKQPQLSHKMEIYGGIMEEECQSLLKEFFQHRR